MRVDTLFKYHFTFEYWTLTTDLNGVTDFAHTSDSTGMMVPTGGRDSFALITKEQMEVPMQIRNLRDRSGTVITQVGGEQYPMYIVGAEPQLDPFSNVIAYRHTLNRNVPREYQTFLDEILDSVG